MTEKRPWLKYYDPGVPPTIHYPDIPVQQLLHVAAAAQPHQASTNFFGTVLTFRRIRSQVLRMANALIGMGIQKGDRVALALPNCPQYVVAYYGVLSAGGIVVNMNPLYTFDELKFMMENAGVETLITFDGALGVMRPLSKALKLKNVIVTALTDYIKGFTVSNAETLKLDEGWSHFSELLDVCSNERVLEIPFAATDTAVIQFTGGTTGLPKGAMLSHGNIIAAAFQGSIWGTFVTMNIPTSGRSVIGVIPYFHSYGNTCCLNWAMYNAATQILFPRFALDEFFDTLAHFDQVTYFPAVPTMLTAIFNHPKAAAMDLGAKIGLISSGGAPMPVELIRKIRDMGIFFSEGWGMSETVSSGISSPILRHKVGSIGIPGPDSEVRLVDIETGTHEVKQGEPGEILLKSPTVMTGYWNNPEETQNHIKNGWISTGDIAHMDEEGYLYIVDRKKDMIIAGGFNIYPREVDEVLYQHSKVQEAVCVGVPDAYRGETVKAFIVCKPGMTVTEQDIIDFCKTKLAPYKVPKLVEFRTELPKSAVGKVLRKILRDEEIAKSDRQGTKKDRV
jgi:long-chain acyl-CoA synthetase